MKTIVDAAAEETEEDLSIVDCLRYSRCDAAKAWKIAAEIDQWKC
jgi:hypothetical protein